MNKKPGSLTGITIGQMKIGDSGYVPPWCAFFDSDRELYVHTTFKTHKEVYGTASMKIERITNGVAVYTDTVGDREFNTGVTSLSIDKANRLPATLK